MPHRGIAEIEVVDRLAPFERQVRAGLIALLPRQVVAPRAVEFGEQVLALLDQRRRIGRKLGLFFLRVQQIVVHPFLGSVCRQVGRRLVVQVEAGHLDVRIERVRVFEKGRQPTLVDLVSHLAQVGTDDAADGVSPNILASYVARDAL